MQVLRNLPCVLNLLLEILPYTPPHPHPLTGPAATWRGEAPGSRGRLGQLGLLGLRLSGFRLYGIWGGGMWRLWRVWSGMGLGLAV